MGTRKKQFAGRQGNHARDFAGSVPFVPKPPAPARGRRVSLPRAHFSSLFPLPWQRERARRLHRLCKAVERRRSAGISVRKAVRYFAWFWRNRPYRTAPHIKAKFKRPTIVALYYHWRRNGKSPDCFAQRYGGRLGPVTRREMRRFLGACGKAGTVSLSQAAKLAGFDRAKACRIRVRLPRQLVDQIKGIFKERRKADREARAAVKRLRWQSGLWRSADVGRKRKLERLCESLIGRRAASGVESTSQRSKAPIQAVWRRCKRVLQEV